MRMRLRRERQFRRSRSGKMRVLQYLWFHFITVATSWLPDLRPVLRLRGFLLRPSFKSCGGNLQVARHVTINFTNRLEIGSDVFLATGCWLHARGGIVLEDEVQLGPYSVLVTRRPHTDRRILPIWPKQSCADSHLPGVVGRGPRHGHEGCGHRTRRPSRGQFRGHARCSAVCDGGRRSRARHS